MRLSTQLDVYSPGLVHLPVSNARLQLPSPNVAAEIQLFPFVQRCTHSSCLFWLSFTTVIIQAHASWFSEKPSCTKILRTFHLRPRAIRFNYSIKKFTKWCTPLHLTLWFHINDSKRSEDQQYHSSFCHDSLVKNWEIYHSLITCCFYKLITWMYAVANLQC